jgi:hypothetical protein
VKNTILIAALFFGCVTFVRSQDSTAVIVVIKTTPSLIFDVDNTPTLAAEWLFSKNWGLQQEIGWGNAHINPWQNQRDRFPNKENWRFKTQIRYYSKKLLQSDTRFYTAFEWFRKEIFITQNQYIGQDCSTSTNVCGYFKQTDVNTRRSVSVLSIKFGLQFSVYRRMMIDLYLGGGMRSRTVTNNLSSTERSRNFRLDWWGFSTLSPSVSGPDPSLTAGFSVGYKIFKKK